MQSDIQAPRKEWIAALPFASVAYPDGSVDKLKYYFWRAFTPYHPVVRDACLKLGIAKHDFRQDYLLGTLDSKHTIEELITFLVSRGYGNHFVAWHDPGQVVSLRYTENFFYQYHIRIFEDGEVRGHYEYTPEYRPISHMRDVGQEERRPEFLELLKGWVVPSNSS